MHAQCSTFFSCFIAFDHTLLCFGRYWFKTTFEVSGNRCRPRFCLRSALSAEFFVHSCLLTSLSDVVSDI